MSFNVQIFCCCEGLESFKTNKQKKEIYKNKNKIQLALKKKVTEVKNQVLNPTVMKRPLIQPLVSNLIKTKWKTVSTWSLLQANCVHIFPPACWTFSMGCSDFYIKVIWENKPKSSTTWKPFKHLEKVMSPRRTLRSRPATRRVFTTPSHYGYTPSTQGPCPKAHSLWAACITVPLPCSPR